MQTPENPDGVLLVDKPQGCTSHDVVDRIRRKLGTRKVGHAGTLDPLATGMLIILVGKATKVSQYLMSLPKVYEGCFRLGESTDSHDAEGKIIAEHEVPELSDEQIREAMAAFSGDQYQTPPMFSAKKHKGKPLYKLARKGEVVEREPRFIHVSQFELLSYNSPEGTFRMACSKGTYVRTLINDFGDKLGCGAHMRGLRRTDIDRFSINDATTVDDIEAMPLAEIRRLLIPAYQAVPSNVL